jgi:ABC-type Fe3+-hydroxamate transport system substrate-binding protein
MSVLRVTDDRGVRLLLPRPPERIVSLVPSDTYSLVRLGAKARLVGRTRYCVEPSARGDNVADVPVVGGTKDVDLPAVFALSPDLVVANQEENTRADVLALEAAGVPVLVSFPRTVADGMAHVARLARALGFTRGEEPAHGVVAAAYHALKDAEAPGARHSSLPPLRAFMPIWMDPLMTIHGSTFISDALTLAGAENVFADRERRYPLAADVGSGTPLPADRIAGRDVRYPRVTLDEVVARAPELVLLPDEPHPFTQADADVFKALDIPAARARAVRFCDGKDVMWYGLRAIEGLARLRALVDSAR